jgi:H(+)-transporting ATP synthase subunit D
MPGHLRLAPTRLTLLRLQRRHKTLVSADALLERKRQVLGQMLAALMPRWRARRAEAYGMLATAYQSFGLTRMRSSGSELRQVVGGMAPMVTVAWRRRIISGVSTFEAACEAAPLRPRFGLLGTTAELDRTVALLRDAIASLAELAALETSLRSLAGALEKTNRQVRTLRDWLIPVHEATIRWIADTLEEQERGYLFQLKRLTKESPS